MVEDGIRVLGRRGLHFVLVLVRTLASGYNLPSEATWMLVSLGDGDYGDTRLTRLRVQDALLLN